MNGIKVANIIKKLVSTLQNEVQITEEDIENSRS